ncbi:50S ribosomal protein L15 [Olsenella sp. YH-ols2217]|uniref:Large ribosomal subunit protein uL15 n=1 Tax=Kribbibacterium absianum TaxID=3044210 RepID=A0ABT6ZKT6_9ACTN|nr:MULTISPECIES: 50S ribosomal protein L15 [unclassified Olsenella]MDJ1121659.1 50S ribosomal protein L15 [Olsenella sp. YH-ols2216]MDJ1129667.1 50S ribosomal protein L15 [Olsenella sp. YH-ols2217]
MQLHDLKPNKGAKKARKRVGRGNSAGGGTTAGRGTKGQLSRSGGGKGAGFEGGQNPLAMRLPKLPGFRNPSRVEYAPVNVSRLNEKFNDGDVVDGESLTAAGIIKKPTVLVKVLGDGDLEKALTVKVAKVSKTAQQKIEAAGGKVE